MDKHDTEKFRKRLLEEKDRLVAELQELQEENLGESQSEMSGENSFENHLADSGTATFERERDLSLERNISDMLHKVDDALKRIDNGDFAVCESCGRRISEERLNALPYVNLCIECQEREERNW